MLATSFLVLLMIGAALIAVPLFLAGLAVYCFGLRKEREKLRRRGRILMLTGILLAVGNPVAWSAADSVLYGIASGESGARWVSYNAPGSGFIWNGTRYVVVEDLQTYSDEQRREWLQAAQVGDGKDVLIRDEREKRLRIYQPKDYGDYSFLVELLAPDWAYPLENDAGFDLYHHDMFIYCPEKQHWEVSSYFAHDRCIERVLIE